MLVLFVNKEAKKNWSKQLSICQKKMFSLEIFFEYTLRKIKT